MKEFPFFSGPFLAAPTLHPSLVSGPSAPSAPSPSRLYPCQTGRASPPRPGGAPAPPSFQEV